jgi:hypothetical protein
MMLVVVAYMLISASMLVLNRATIQIWRAPITLVLLQNATTTLIIYATSRNRPTLSWATAYKWRYAVSVWVLPLMLNIKAVEHLDVSTLIIFRSLTTCGVVVSEMAFLQLRLTRMQEVSLSLSIVGCALYGYMGVQQPSLIGTPGLVWGSFYTASMVLNNVYTKHALTVHAPKSVGTQEVVLYNNLMSLVPLAGISAWAETSDHRLQSWTQLALVSASCVLSASISYVGTACRRCVSATSFVMLGNSCKILSVAASHILLSEYVSSAELSALILAVGGCCLYGIASSPVE